MFHQIAHSRKRERTRTDRVINSSQQSPYQEKRHIKSNGKEKLQPGIKKEIRGRKEQGKGENEPTHLSPTHNQIFRCNPKETRRDNQEQREDGVASHLTSWPSAGNTTVSASASSTSVSSPSGAPGAAGMVVPKSMIAGSLASDMSSAPFDSGSQRFQEESESHVVLALYEKQKKSKIPSEGRWGWATGRRRWPRGDRGARRASESARRAFWAPNSRGWGSRWVTSSGTRQKQPVESPTTTSLDGLFSFN